MPDLRPERDRPGALPVTFPGSITAPGSHRKRRRRALLAVAPVAVVALASGAFANRAAAASSSDRYRTVAVGEHAIESVLTGVATIEPVSQAAVAFLDRAVVNGGRDSLRRRRTAGAAVLRLVPRSEELDSAEDTAVAHHEADADARADGGAAVDDASTDGGETADDFAWVGFSEDVKHGVVSLMSVLAICLAWSVFGVQRAADVHGSEDREDEGLQEGDEHLEPCEGDQEAERERPDHEQQ